MHAKTVSISQSECGMIRCGKDSCDEFSFCHWAWTSTGLSTPAREWICLVASVFVCFVCVWLLAGSKNWSFFEKEDVKFGQRMRHTVTVVGINTSAMDGMCLETDECASVHGLARSQVPFHFWRQGRGESVG